MKPIAWPRSRRAETLRQMPLPELELTGEDYDAAAEALRKLEGCFSEVVFVYEVAARHCRERQLRAELLGNRNLALLERSDAKHFVNQWKKPTSITQFTAEGTATSR